MHSCMGQYMMKCLLICRLEFRDEKKVFRLKRVIYGLRMSPKIWNEHFNNFIVNELKFIRLQSDCCIYTQNNELRKLYLLLYVDDVLVMSTSAKHVKKVKQQLIQNFEMSDAGSVDTFLEIKINFRRETGIMAFDQSRFIEKVC